VTKPKLLEKSNISWKDLLLTNELEFTKFCRLEHFQASGSGGQKRNKKKSAARAIFKDLQTEACEFRETKRNEKLAINKLKKMIAFTNPLDKYYEIEHLPYPISTKNSNYYFWLAVLVFELHKNEFSSKEVSLRWQKSHSSLLKLIFKDKALWEYFTNERKKRGLPTMQAPK
jgi:hypothetical protein